MASEDIVTDRVMPFDLKSAAGLKKGKRGPGRPPNPDPELVRKAAIYDEFAKWRFGERTKVYDPFRNEVMTLAEARRLARRMRIMFLIPVEFVRGEGSDMIGE